MKSKQQTENLRLYICVVKKAVLNLSWGVLFIELDGKIETEKPLDLMVKEPMGFRSAFFRKKGPQSNFMVGL